MHKERLWYNLDLGSDQFKSIHALEDQPRIAGFALKKRDGRCRASEIRKIASIALTLPCPPATEGGGEQGCGEGGGV